MLNSSMCATDNFTDSIKLKEGGVKPSCNRTVKAKRAIFIDDSDNQQSLHTYVQSDGNSVATEGVCIGHSANANKKTAPNEASWQLSPTHTALDRKSKKKDSAFPKSSLTCEEVLDHNDAKHEEAKTPQGKNQWLEEIANEDVCKYFCLFFSSY